jgi:hypothetical protein
MLLDKALTLVIPSTATRDDDDRDLDNLMKSYALAEQAKDAFLAQEVTFDEYLQLLESHQINVDSYMETIEHNLQEFCLI